MRTLILAIIAALWTLPVTSSAKDWPRGEVDVADFSAESPLILMVRYQKLIRAIDQLLPADLPERELILTQINQPLGLDPTLLDFKKPMFLSVGESTELGRSGRLTSTLDFMAGQVFPLRARGFFPSRAPKDLAPALGVALQRLGAAPIEGGGWAIEDWAVKFTPGERGVDALAYGFGSPTLRLAALAAPAPAPLKALETSAVKATREPYAILTALARPGKIRGLAVSAGATSVLGIAEEMKDKAKLSRLLRDVYQLLLMAETTLSGGEAEVEEIAFDLRAGANEIRLVTTATLTEEGRRLFNFTRPTEGAHLEINGAALASGLLTLDLKRMSKEAQGIHAFKRADKLRALERVMRECGFSCYALGLSSPISFFKDVDRLAPPSRRQPIPMGAQWVTRLNEEGALEVGLAFLFEGDALRTRFRAWLKEARLFKGFKVTEEEFGAYHALLLGKGAEPISFFAGYAHTRDSFFKLNIGVDALPKLIEGFKLKGELAPIAPLLKDVRMVKAHLTRSDDTIFGELLIGRTEHNRKLADRGHPTGTRVPARALSKADVCMLDVSLGLVEQLSASKGVSPVRFGDFMSKGLESMSKEIECAAADPAYREALLRLQARILGAVLKPINAPQPASAPASAPDAPKPAKP